MAPWQKSQSLVRLAENLACLDDHGSHHGAVGIQKRFRVDLGRYDD